MSDEYIRSGFVRARRFLIAVSLTLICLNILGLEFKEISILGNTAEIHHPEHVLVLIWGAWFWATVQYIVWFRDFGVWSEFQKTIRLDCVESFRSMAETNIPLWLQDQLRSELEGRIGTENLGSLHYAVRLGGSTGDGRRIERAVQVFAGVQTRTPKTGYLETSQEIRFEMPVTKIQWRIRFALAGAGALFGRRFLLEYFALFFIGLAPFVVWLGYSFL